MGSAHGLRQFITPPSAIAGRKHHVFRLYLLPSVRPSVFRVTRYVFLVELDTIRHLCGQCSKGYQGHRSMNDRIVVK